MISIVIPYYNHWDLVHNRLWELYRLVPVGDVEIILVNDGSTEDDRGGVGWWQQVKNGHKIRYIERKENKGFGYSMNEGADKANGDIIILLSNDVLVNDNFVSKVVTLLTNNNRAVVGGELLDFDTGWNTFKGKVYPYLNGWLLAFTKEGWKELGGFDLSYSISDMEDIDICTKALSLGYSLLPLNNPKLRHLGGQTAGYGPDRQERTKKNQLIFISKWVK